MFLRIHIMIDKASWGLDKMFFALGNALLLQCKHRDDVRESS